MCGMPHAARCPKSARSRSLVTGRTQLDYVGQARAKLGGPRVTLLDLLREHLNLTGTKKGCDHGQCGACTVLANGRRINSCLSLALVHDGEQIVTIEGLAHGDELHPLQAAFIEYDGFQCGYCTPGANLFGCSSDRRSAAWRCQRGHGGSVKGWSG